MSNVENNVCDNNIRYLSSSFRKKIPEISPFHLKTDNVARGKSASISGLKYRYGTADNALDGNAGPRDSMTCVWAGKWHT